MTTTVFSVITWVNANKNAALDIVKRGLDTTDLLGAVVSNSYDREYDVYLRFSDGGDTGFQLRLYDPRNYLVAQSQSHRTETGHKSDVFFSPSLQSGSHREEFIAKLPGLSACAAPEEGLALIVKYVKDTYQAPVSRGCIAAHLADTDFFWVSKRRSSANVAEINGKFRLMTNNPSFVKVFTAVDRSTSEWRRKNIFSSSSVDYKKVSSEYWLTSLLVPIYHGFNSAIRIGQSLYAYVLPAANLSSLYRVYAGHDGNPVYTCEPMPYADYNRKPLHNYSTRIETLLQGEDLFRTGKVDLYRNRDKGEVPYLGWELEACDNASLEGHEETATAMRDSLDKMVMCKPDGSISPRGFETVSVPGTLDFWKEADLPKALDKMRRAPYNMRSYEHSSCGLHVHVSRAALSVLDLQKIERFMHNPSNRNFLQKVAGRDSTNYARYNDSYFTNRKSLVSSGGRDGSRSFRETGRQRLIDYVGTAPSVATPRYLAEALYQFTTIDEHIGPRGLLRVVSRVRNGTSTPEDVEHVIDCVTVAVNRVPDDSLSTFLKLVLSVAFPGREFVFNDSAPVAGHPMAHLVGVRKTKLPLGRKNSYAAAQECEGAVGKGRERYDVLNTSNTNTVEFRLFKGTMNGDSIYRYLEFVDALVRFVPNIAATDGALIYHNFVQWIVSDSFNRARYSSLLAFFVANDFVKRGDIRKRDLKTVIELDNVIEAVVVEPEPQVDDEEEYEPEYDEDEEEYDDEDGERCSCGCGMIVG